MNGKEEYYNLIICQENAYPIMTNTRTDEDLIEKFIKCREDKFAYFNWNKGCIPMRHLLGVMLQ
jgi:hypothetical protein